MAAKNLFGAQQAAGADAAAIVRLLFQGLFFGRRRHSDRRSDLAGDAPVAQPPLGPSDDDRADRATCRATARKDGWPGLLLGDISQPRGGPMLTGHASHQIGLDADIWLTPMPSRTLSRERARRTCQATSMIDKTSLTVDPKRLDAGAARLLKRAASYPEVERILVHPGIKKKLCDTVKGDRAWLAQGPAVLGPRLSFPHPHQLPAGLARLQGAGSGRDGDGCGKALAWWFTEEPWRPAKKDRQARSR